MHDFTNCPSIHASSVCILLLVYLVACISGEYDPREVISSVTNDRTDGGEFRSCIDGKCIKRTTHEISSGMWFGPRLGRRRRSNQKAQVAPEIEAIVNMLDGVDGWVLISTPAEKRQTPAFTPRLGRESDEDFLAFVGPRDQNENQDDDSPPPLFAPRLGRRLAFSPSPRLGRQLRPLYQKV